MNELELNKLNNLIPNSCQESVHDTWLNVFVMDGLLA